MVAASKEIWPKTIGEAMDKMLDCYKLPPIDKANKDTEVIHFIAHMLAGEQSTQHSEAIAAIYGSVLARGEFRARITGTYIQGITEHYKSFENMNRSPEKARELMEERIKVFARYMEDNGLPTKGMTPIKDTEFQKHFERALKIDDDLKKKLGQHLHEFSNKEIAVMDFDLVKPYVEELDNNNHMRKALGKDTSQKRTYFFRDYGD